MIGKMMGLMGVLLMVLFGVAFMYQNLLMDSVELRTNYFARETGELVEYGDVPVFAENLRFNHNLISYFIEEDCEGDKRDAMIEAFNLFSAKVGVVSFFEVGNSDEADIEVGCSDDYIELGERLFAAGEGGPSKIINTSFFKTIEKGKISLYNGPRCDYPVVEVHELGHVFGFDHSDDPLNIMYNISDCRQRISDDMVDLMVRLYSIEALADASINELKAVRKGKYLDFNISVLNEGLLGIPNISLTIVVDDKEIEKIELGEIKIGYGRTLRIENMRLPSRNAEKIGFVLDAENLVREINEDNNFAETFI